MRDAIHRCIPKAFPGLSSAALRELRALRVSGCRTADMRLQRVFHAEGAELAEIRGELQVVVNLDEMQHCSFGGGEHTFLLCAVRELHKNLHR